MLNIKRNGETNNDKAYNEINLESKKECQKPSMIIVSNAIVDPSTMVVSSFNTMIACHAVIGSR